MHVLVQAAAKMDYHDENQLQYVCKEIDIYIHVHNDDQAHMSNI